MATVNVATELPAPPEKVWAVLADPNKFEDWLTIHQGWRGDIPAEVGVGTQLSEIVTVMGMANKIDWTVQEYDPPSSMKIAGAGMAGVQVSFTLSVESSGEWSTAKIDAEFTGQMVVGALGTAVEKNSKAELEKSLAKLGELLG